MKTSIYISAEQMHIVGYVGSEIKKVVAHPMSEGVILNGQVMDKELLTEYLFDAKATNPDLFKQEVTLVVDGGSVLSRRLVAPKLKRKQYLQLVRDDFVDSIGDVDDLVCDYRKLEFSENAILGVAANKVLVDRFDSAFKEAGIELAGIRVGADLLLSYARSRNEFKKGAVVLNVLDGLFLLSMIFVDGDNVFTSRTRFFEEDKTQIILGMVNSLGGLIQFAQTQGRGERGEITASYYLGLDPMDIALLEQMSSYDGIKYEALPLATGVPYWAHFAYLNVHYGAKSLDFLTMRKELELRLKNQKPRKWWLVAITTYALILGGVAGFLWFSQQEAQGDIDAILAQLESPLAAHRQQEIEEVMAETDRLNSILRQIEFRAEQEAETPAATSEMLDFILHGHGLAVSITSFDFNESTGMARISAVTANAMVQLDYINALYRQGIASQVNYQGFSSGIDGTISFSLDIVLGADDSVE